METILALFEKQKQAALRQRAEQNERIQLEIKEEMEHLAKNRAERDKGE